MQPAVDLAENQQAHISILDAKNPATAERQNTIHAYISPANPQHTFANF